MSGREVTSLVVVDNKQQSHHLSHKSYIRFTHTHQLFVSTILRMMPFSLFFLSIRTMDSVFTFYSMHLGADECDAMVIFGYLESRYLGEGAGQHHEKGDNDNSCWFVVALLLGPAGGSKQGSVLELGGFFYLLGRIHTQLSIKWPLLLVSMTHQAPCHQMVANHGGNGSKRTSQSGNGCKEVQQAMSLYSCIKDTFFSRCPWVHQHS